MPAACHCSQTSNKLIEFAGPVKLNWLTMKPDDRVTFQFVPPGNDTARTSAWPRPLCSMTSRWGRW